MIQQSHFWIYIWRKENSHLKRYMLPVFIAALFTVITIWKQLVSTNEWMIKKLWYWEFPGYPVVRIQCFHCWGLDSIPGWGTKILQAVWNSQKKKKEKKRRRLKSCIKIGSNLWGAEFMWKKIKHQAWFLPLFLLLTWPHFTCSKPDGKFPIHCRLWPLEGQD